MLAQQQRTFWLGAVLGVVAILIGAWLVHRVTRRIIGSVADAMEVQVAIPKSEESTAITRARTPTWSVGTAAAAAAAVISVSVAAPSAGESSSGTACRKSSRSSDFGGLRPK